MPKIKFEGKVARQNTNVHHVTIPNPITKACKVKSGDKAIVILLEDDEEMNEDEMNRLIDK